MGMGTFACGADTISFENLKKICPDEVQSIEDDMNLGSWLGLARAVEFSEWDSFSEEIFDNYEEDDKRGEDLEKFSKEVAERLKNKVEILCKNFNKETGLELYLTSYTEDEGDRYDEANDHEGCVFSLSGVYQLTPAGEKYKDVIVKAMWTQFG